MPVIRLWVIHLDFLKSLSRNIERGRLKKDSVDSGLVLLKLSRREDGPERVFDPSEEESDIWGWVSLRHSWWAVDPSLMCLHTLLWSSFTNDSEPLVTWENTVTLADLMQILGGNVTM